MSIMITSRAINNSLSELRLVLRIPLLTTLLIMALQSIAFSQNVSINATGASPDNSAMLDVSSTSQGLLIPRMTAAQRGLISAPAQGLMIFQTDGNSGVWLYDTNQTGWIVVTTGAQFDTDSTRLADNDGNTKIQVEETTNEDMIRFDLGGTERFVMEGRRIEFVNSGGSVYIGEQAGANDASGSLLNVAVGDRALESNSGSGNVAIGRYAGRNQTSGFGNTNVGEEAGYSNTLGSGNTIIGYRASILNTPSSNNTVIGHDADFFNTNGSNNTIIGYQAGRGAGTHTKSGNIFIGRQAGLNDTTNNKLYIENSNSSTPLIYGDFASDSLKIYGSLSVADEYTLPLTDGTNGQIMQTDGAGNVSWQSQASSPWSLDNDTVSVLGKRVGIGTTNPSAALHIESDGAPQIISKPTATTGQDGQILIRGARNASTSNNQASLTFENYDNDLAASSILGQISGRVTNSTSNVGDMVFYSSADGSALSESMRVNSDGNLGIGISNPANKLHIRGNATQNVMARFERNPAVNGESGAIEIVGARQLQTANVDIAYIDFKNYDANEGGGTEFTLSRITGFSVFNSQERGGIKMYVNTGTSGPGLVKAMQINHDGVMTLGSDSLTGSFAMISDQGATDYRVDINPNASMTQNTAYVLPPDDGDASEVLTTDGSGNLSWQTFSSVNGSGSTNRLARWSNASTLDSSLIQDDGATIGINVIPSAFRLVHAQTNSNTITTGVYGEHTLNSATITRGVWGESASTDQNNSAGVYGSADNGAYAIYGQSGSSNTGVVVINGYNSAGGTNENYGVKGQTSSSNAGSAGLYGFAFHGGNAILAQSNARVIEAEAFGVRTTSYNAMELNNLATSSTASINKTGLNIQSTGSWTGASAENVGLNVNVAGATTNYAALFNGGNVGIGTVAPNGALEVVTDGSLIGGLRVSNTTAATVGASIYLDGSTKDWTITATNSGSGAGTDKLVFRDYSSAADRMTITGTGNVGIGNTSPSFPLSINGATPGDANSAHIQIVENTGSSSMHIGRALAYGFVQTQNAHPLALNPIGNNVGIGTTNPLSLLHVQSSTTQSTIRLTNSATASNGLWLSSDNIQSYLINYENTPLKFATNGADRMTITAAGDVGIGTTAPVARLDVRGVGDIMNISSGAATSNASLNIGRVAVEGQMSMAGTAAAYSLEALAGDFVIRNSGGGKVLLQSGVTNSAIAITSINRVGINTISPDQVLSVNGNASKTGGGTWVAFSDIRVKKDVSKFNDGLELLKQINPVKFKYNGLAGNPDDGTEYVGVIAQDVQKIAPYMISTVPKKLHESDEGETDLLMYDGSALTYILVNAIKEQQAIIDTLRENESSNKEEIGELKAMLENYLQSEGINPEDFKKQMDTVAKK